MVKFFQNNLGKLFFATLFALVTLGAMPAHATTVSYSDSDVMTADGQDFTFNFDGLLPSDGTGGRITIASGDASNSNNAAHDGFDLDGASEYFNLLFDGNSQGTYTCDPDGSHTHIPNSIVSNILNCKFELVIELSGQELDALLADAIISIAINFSGNVSHLDHGDEILVTLEYTEKSASEVPLPAALPLFVAGIAGVGAVSWRRRSTKQKKLAA